MRDPILPSIKATSVAHEEWVTRRRARRALPYAQATAFVLAGVLVGRVYSIVTAPAPPSPWWTIQIGGNGVLSGPLVLKGADGAVNLRLPEGAAVVNDGGKLGVRGNDIEIRNLQIVTQDFSFAPAAARSTPPEGGSSDDDHRHQEPQP